jgi:RNA-directed DNA polymerase
MKNKARYERYELSRSPFAQDPNQRDLAILLGTRKTPLEKLISRKERYIIRRNEEINGKQRELRYPFGALRRIHERMKFHLNKIEQPEYLYSPRKGTAQRDNALFHAGQRQYLKLDIKQFYPSTTTEHIFRWAKYDLGMKDDVAGMVAALATIDGVAAFGSPLTPVLAALVHRRMFNAIHAECCRRGLRISLWVDDIVVSGNFVPGVLVRRIREIIKSNGLRSHKLESLTGSRSLIVSCVRIIQRRIDAPRSLHFKIESLYRALAQTDDPIQAEIILDTLLSVLGTYRYLVGRKTLQGQNTSNKMNFIRRHRNRMRTENQSIGRTYGSEMGIDFNYSNPPF